MQPEPLLFYGQDEEHPVTGWYFKRNGILIGPFDTADEASKAHQSVATPFQATIEGRN